MRRNPVAALAVAVGLLCLLIAGVASAANRTVSWTLPTANVDGSALPASQITRTTVYWGTSQSTMTNSRAITGAATSATIDFAPGTWYVAARTTANGNDSALSNVVQVVISQPTPNPPTGLSVVAVVAGLNMSPVYAIEADSTGARIVKGFADLGTPCSGPFVFRYRERDYHEIPASKVKWWGPTLADVRNPPAVAAPCA
jgi:hypothetical protein